MSTPWRGTGRKEDQPCLGCPDRYTACSDRCTKPEFLAWKERHRRTKQARMEHTRCDTYVADQISRNRRVK